MNPRGRRPPVAGAVLAMLVLAGACTGDGIEISIGGSTPVPSITRPALDGVRPVHTGEEKSRGAMQALCVAPEPFTFEGGRAEEPPPSIREVERQVQTVRGLELREPVPIHRASQGSIAGDLSVAFDAAHPESFYRRRSAAWQTIGVIPGDVQIRDALRAMRVGQVVGFYDPSGGELVYVADDDEALDLTERFTLAHELTHAVDDQHFDLARIDRLGAACLDDASWAALGSVEGSAQFFAVRALTQFPDPEAELGDAGDLRLPEEVPPFITTLELWPYTAGQAFVGALDERGGQEAVDASLERFPVSTEQVLHPERYPSDRPTALDIADRSEALGPGWGDLDVMQVGELWLRSMLALHLEESVAEDAAAGWDGGLYRAWTDGRDVAVLLETAWDSAGDASAFADAMQAWLDAAGVRGSVSADEDRVTVAFATSDAALASVQATT